MMPDWRDIGVCIGIMKNYPATSRLWHYEVLKIRCPCNALSLNFGSRKLASQQASPCIYW